MPWLSQLTIEREKLSFHLFSFFTQQRQHASSHQRPSRHSGLCVGKKKRNIVTMYEDPSFYFLFGCPSLLRIQSHC